MNIRTFQPRDLEQLRQLTVEGFTGIAIDQNVEKSLGILAGHDWRWRKAQHVNEDIDANPSGVFVAEEDGLVVGYISTRLDHAAGKGRIPNLVVANPARGKGIGRELIQFALDYFRREGMAFAMIETMVNNPIGQHLYPACGFVEVGRQIHYAMKL